MGYNRCHVLAVYSRLSSARGARKEYLVVIGGYYYSLLNC